MSSSVMASESITIAGRAQEKVINREGRMERKATGGSEVAVLVPKYELPAAPSWERARELAEEVKKSIRAIVLLGMEIEALRNQWFGDGHGGDRKSQEWARNQAPHPCGARSEKGWQAKVRDELGISDDTARRLMDKARYVCMLEDVTRGEEVEYTDSRNKTSKLVPTAEMRQMAFRFLDDVVAGTVNPKRAWAGLVGEGSRRDNTGSANRAPVDHYRNLKGALTALKTSLRQWNKLEPGQRAELETLWADISRKLPDTWRE
jgi:FtsZ-binding cell division protein ZapB